MKPLSTEQVNHILLLLDLGHSGHSIHHQTGISVSKVSQLRKEHRPHLQKSTGGCPKILSDMDLRHSTRLLTSGQVDNAPQLARRLQEIKGRPISAQTVRRGLKSVGMKAVVKVKKPLLKAHHKRARKEFAERYLHWTVEDWKRVIWSDETKINRIGSDGRSWGWKRRGERLSDRLVTPTLKFGGGFLMLWGCMSWEGVGHACKIEGRMDANCYVDILEDELQKFMRKIPKRSSFSRIMTQNIPARRPKNGSKTVKWRSWSGQHNLQTLIPLNTYGNISSRGFVPMKIHHRG